MRPTRPIEPAIRALIARARSTRATQRKVAWAGAAGSLALAAAVALVWAGAFGSRIHFTVGPSLDSGIENRWIGAEAAEPVPLHFSDGTAIDLLPGTRARVASLNRRGASLNLETGRLHANVVHRRFADWTIGAGPYTVRVIGTEFDVVWNPETEELEVDVRRGLVKVAGPVLADDQSVSAKQRLTVALRDRHATISPFDAETEARTELAARDSSGSESAASEDPAASVRERSSGSDTGSHWLALAKRGEYQKALELVQRSGFDNVMQSAGANELLRLSDVARMGGQASRASEILHLARKRFPRTEAASVAAYTLGVTAFDRSGAYAEAAKWFEIYLRERPSGPLSAEALGRLMEAQDRLGRRERAQASARKYLKLHPHGAHRDVASRLNSR
jgi:TolA-binding protein